MANLLKEKEDFQKLIIERLVEENKYIERSAVNYNKALAMDTELFFEFLNNSQPDVYEKLKKIYKKDTNDVILAKINAEINKSSRGLIDVLKKGVDFDSVLSIKLLYDKPATTFNKTSNKLYSTNIFSVMEEVYHKDAERIDLVLFVNGFAIITMELKCNTSGQNVQNAIEQYRTDRDSNSRLLKYKIGALVNFAMDLEEVYMCTKLNGKASYFLPFNQGNGEDGKGNPEPIDKTKLKVSYMWEDILTKDTLIYLIERFIFIEKSVKENKITGVKKVDETLIFPRYHQLNAVRRIVNDVKEYHTSKDYLIQHSAGSGKTNTIAWLSHICSDLHDDNNNNIFDTIIVMTDRIIVDRQLQDAILNLSHKSGVIKVLDDKCTAQDLKTAINGNTKIVVTTIQKFRYICDEIKNSSEKKFAVLIDEAHASTSGQNMLAVKKALNADDEETAKSMADEIEQERQKSGKQANVSMIAFTATPTKKTFEIFGTLDKNGHKKAFDLYSMKQAIDEGFILNVLENYVTYKTYYQLNKIVEADPPLKKVEAARQIHDFVELHDTNISQKVQIIIEHFKNNIMGKVLNGNEKAMVVTSSRASAVKYKQAFERYIQQQGYKGIKALVAFSGTVTLKDDETQYTSLGMNLKGNKLSRLFDNEDDYIRQSFDTDEYQVLLVANKFQTGFDQKKLVAMYVDKTLKGVAAVQTLSRLNRICPPYNKKTFVLDFKNSYEDIKKSFAMWYKDTKLLESVNPEDIRVLEDKIDSFGILDFDDIEDFNRLVYKPKRNSKEKEKMWTLLQVSKNKFDTFKEGDKHEIISTIKKFVKFYEFLIQVTTFKDENLHKKYNFLTYLIKELIIAGTNDFDISDKICATDFVQKKEGEYTDGTIIPGEGMKAPKPNDILIDREEKQLLSEIIEEINQFFNKEYDVDVAVKAILQIRDLLLHDKQLQECAKVETLKNFKFKYNDSVKKALINGYDQNQDFFSLLLNNEELKERFMKVYMEDIYKELKK